jgi:hypothetical protein
MSASGIPEVCIRLRNYGYLHIDVFFLIGVDYTLR